MAATGVSLQTLVEVNCIADAGILVVGRVIYLPRVPTQIAPTNAGDTAGSTSPPVSNDNQSESNDNHDDHNDNDDSHSSNSGSGSGNSGSGSSGGSDDD
ncbi:MAG: hypothetical protein IH587_08720 [Anaerolineae bacterium]|nr:hypothetical protein [Anaerolineae bacterium]